MTKNFVFLFVLFSVGFSFCKTRVEPDLQKKQFTIFYTNDEHGWIEGDNDDAGAVDMYPDLLDYGYGEDESMLLLSGGDNWSGPAISSWFKGQPAIEVMNAMGYMASALGNHEFDAKVENLEKLSKQAKFSMLSANIIDNNTGTFPDFVKPYIIIKKQNVKIGIIGLSSLSTPYTTFPAYVKDYTFTDYAQALKKYVPEMKKNGAEVLILIGHICNDEMEELKPLAKDLGICFIGGAHCHQSFVEKDNEIVLMQAGSYYRKYGKFVFNYNPSSQKVEIVSAQVIKNIKKSGVENPVTDIVDYWSAKVDSALSDTIGYASSTIYYNSNEMANMVTDSWLVKFPEAQVSITNSGGIRQDIEAGYITLEDIVGVLPFNNTLLELDLTGKQLIDCIKDYELGGMLTIGGNRLTNGDLIYADSLYKVITTDYLYSVSSNHFAEYDSTPYNTSTHYRQPVIDWIRSLKTSKSNALNNYLNGNARHK